MESIKGPRGEMCWGCVFWNYNRCGNANVQAVAKESMQTSNSTLDESIGEVVLARMMAGLCEDASSMEDFDIKTKGNNKGLRYVKGNWKPIEIVEPIISEKSQSALKSNPGRWGKIYVDPSTFRRWREKRSG